MTIDSLRADLAETKLLVHDLNKQLEETRVKLEGAESRAVAAAAAAAAASTDGGKAKDGGDGDAYEAHEKGQRDTIKRLEKEVNGLNTKARMLEVHNDLLVEQEKELRSSFDQMLFFGGLLAVFLVLVFAAEATGLTDVAGGFIGERVATWMKVADNGGGSDGGGGGGGGSCDCTGAVEAAVAVAVAGSTSCPAK